MTIHCVIHSRCTVCIDRGRGSEREPAALRSDLTNTQQTHNSLTMKGLALLLLGAAGAQAQTTCMHDSSGDGRVGVDGTYPRQTVGRGAGGGEGG